MTVKPNRRIVIVSATLAEVKGLIQHLESRAKKSDLYTYQLNQTNVDILIAGIGSTQTAVNVTTYICRRKPDFLIQFGIAGTYNPKLSIGDVVYIASERMIDLGIELADGQWQDVFTSGLIQKDQIPFNDGLLKNQNIPDPPFMPIMAGNSVERVTGTTEKINWILKHAPADVESMEGAAFFYACLMHKIPFMSIRAISNRVEVRNKENWNIPLAIEHLNRDAIEIIQSITNPS